MLKVATIIMGGGQGTRLFPLTVSRCKPALPFGGRYRLIDIPISNAIYSGCRKIFIITQFLSSSLHNHILATYRFSSFSSGFIELLPVEERPTNTAWFQGTADSVRKNVDYFKETPADYFLILSGDQLYHLDFNRMLETALQSGADAVIACLPINEDDAKRMGIVNIDQRGFITAFTEKPQTPAALDPFRLDAKQQAQLEISPTTHQSFLGSMGIYLFKRQALFDLLAKDPREDFGKHLLPTQVAQGNIAAYIHHGYWEDIGTIQSFYQANMALTDKSPRFNCKRDDWTINVHPQSLPGASVHHTTVDKAILCEGSLIDGAAISHSIIGPRTTISTGTTIRDSYFFGNDFYEPPVKDTGLPPAFLIGKRCEISRAIIDKHVHIGDDVKLTNRNNLATYDSDGIYIRDGSVIVTRGTSIPNGFTL